MKEKIYYVYLTTNNINKKKYVGEHATYNLEKDNYLGSGFLFVQKLNEYGKENFKKEILEFFSTKLEAFNAQEKYIQQFNTLVPNGYNISPKGGLQVSGCFSDKTLQKMSISKKGNKYWLGKHHTEKTKELMKKTKKTKDKYKNPETVCVMVRIHVKHESVCHVQFNFGESGSRVKCQKSPRH